MEHLFLVSYIFGNDFKYFIPEVFFIFSLILVFLYGMFALFLSRSSLLIRDASVTSLLFSFVYFYLALLHLNASGCAAYVFNFLFFYGPTILFLKFFLFFLAMVFSLFFFCSTLSSIINSFETVFLFSLSILGMDLLLCANDVSVFYLSLELLSFPLYVLAV